MAISKPKTIKITNHAMQRLQERVKNYDGYRSWQHLVNTARYEGKNSITMSAEEYLWCKTHINKKNKSTKIRVLDGFAYLFMGNHRHARTLVTVIEMS